MDVKGLVRSRRLFAVGRFGGVKPHPTSACGLIVEDLSF